VLFGGHDLALRDTWEFDGSQWLRIPTTITPDPSFAVSLSPTAARPLALPMMAESC